MPQDQSHSLPTTPIALTIAGYDPSSGAGITADLQVFAAFGLFGVSCITACTAQSTRGVAAVQPLSGEWISRTLDVLMSDLEPHGIKIGMLGSGDAVRAVIQFLTRLRAERLSVPIVLDPVLRSSSGTDLLDQDAVDLLQQDLLPLCDTVTPNRRELAALLGQSEPLPDVENGARQLQERVGGREVVVTGGDESRPDDLVLSAGGGATWLRGVPIPGPSTHGTGCAFSSALLARRVAGDPLLESATVAKAYVEQAIRSAPGLGHGKGPLNLLWRRPYLRE